MWRATGRTPGFIAILIVALVGMTTEAAAQEPDEEEPLRLAYVDLTGAEGQASYRAVERLLDDSGQIRLVDGDEIASAAAEAGLDLEAFEADQRGAYEDEFAALMWHHDIESLLIHDIDDSGSNLSVAAIGPMGWEVTVAEKPLESGELGEREAVEVLEEVFSALVPEVRGFRREVERGKWSDEDFELPDADGSTDDDVDLREKAAREHRAKYGNLAPNIALRAGLFSGRRAMQMSEPGGDFQLQHSTMLMGPAVRLDSMVTTFDRHTAAIEVGGNFGMAPFVTVFQGEELSGQYLQFGGEVRYIGAMSASTRLRGIAGVETTNISLQSNDQYTGHGYLNGRIGGGVHYSYEDLATVQVDALFLPILNASNSGGAYGRTTGWLGAGADVGIHLDVFEPVLASIDYGFRFYALNYPEAGGGLEGPGASTDTVHSAMFTVGYRL